MSHENIDMRTAFTSLYQEGCLPSRCIPKFYNRPKIDLTQIDESKLYQWLQNHPDIKELSRMPSYDDNKFGEQDAFGTSEAGCRYYISPIGTFFQMNPHRFYFCHYNIEKMLVYEGCIPPVILKL